MASDPIATHYNPAGLALQPTGVSLDANLSWNQVCFDRRNPGNAPTGPRQEADPDVAAGLQYDPACNARGDFPTTVPSIAVAFRLSRDVGVGIAVVPPAAYGARDEEWSPVTKGYNADPAVRAPQTVPAPYRYMTVGAQSTLLFPTASVGWAISPDVRIGAGFVSGIAVINVWAVSAAKVRASDVGDHANEDAQSHLITGDLFVPGVVLGLQASASRFFDVALWARYLDAIRTHEGRLTVLGRYYNDDLSAPRPVCSNPDAYSTECQGQAIRNEFRGDDFKRFELPLPPEVRAGVRFHQPRRAPGAPAAESSDPLRDDVFDVELDASYSVNSVSDVIRVRLGGAADGTASVPVIPVGELPPNADRYTGFQDSFGLRLGGQWNPLPEKLGLRLGTWFESAAARDDYLHVTPVPAARGGFGGGVVVRQDRLDVQLGYQRHWSATMDNQGEGSLPGNAGVLEPCAGQGCPAPGTGTEPPFQVGKAPVDQQFRTFQAVNGGRVTQSAHVVTLGAVLRFE
ncbi:MAG: hypothetical protein FJ104_04480 [Deltaproteobacteria bacterium]|nr:hypothetical protein [Deltaproteobacteria bacterium]